MSAAYFEQALQNFIYNLAAVQALFPLLKVRVMKLKQDDPLPAIIIGPDKESHENDLIYHGGGVIWSGKIRVVSKVFADTRLLLEAIRNNGSTNPGTGLAGFSGLMDGWQVQGARFEESEFDFIFYEDGTDEGDFIIDTTCVVEFAEPL